MDPPGKVGFGAHLGPGPYIGWGVGSGVEPGPDRSLGFNRGDLGMWFLGPLRWFTLVGNAVGAFHGRDPSGLNPGAGHKRAPLSGRFPGSLSEGAQVLFPIVACAGHAIGSLSETRVPVFRIRIPGNIWVNEKGEAQKKTRGRKNPVMSTAGLQTLARSSGGKWGLGRIEDNSRVRKL